MIRKGFMIFVSIAVITMVFFSCTTKKKEKGEKNKVFLRWSVYSCVTYRKLREETIRGFEKLHSGVKIRLEPTPVGSYYSKLLSMIAGGVAPDIFTCTSTVTFIQKKVLLELTKYIREDEDYFKEIYPSLIEGNYWQRKIYSLPGNCAVDILYYNKKHFDELGLSYPNENWTWDDLLNAAKKLTRRDSRGKVTRFGCVNSTWESTLLILQNGGRIWNDDFTQCIINSPQNREALQFWRDLYAVHHVSPLPGHAKDENPLNAFIIGRASICCGHSWEVRDLITRGKTTGLSWDATLSPKPKKDRKRYVSLRHFTVGVYAKTSHPRLAYELVKYSIRPDIVKAKVEVGDSLPIRKKGVAMDYYLSDPNKPTKAKQSMLKALDYAQSYYRSLMNPHVPYLEQQKIIVENLDRFSLGVSSAEESLQNIERKLNSLLKNDKNQ